MTTAQDLVNEAIIIIIDPTAITDPIDPQPLNKSDYHMRLTFMRNRGELAEGWYEPATKRRADESAHRSDTNQEDHSSSSKDAPASDNRDRSDESEDDSFGPPLPGELDKRKTAAGPAVPSIQDLDLRRGK
ncbi:MAG: hypothetical protein M1816_001553 [Peltula sp. TS41687]|nr:MAG: hypothetical protein M1816_001553 [Peltula sp. TS41687]